MTDQAKERAARLRKARIEAGHKTAKAGYDAVRKAGVDVSPNTYPHNENGNAPFGYSRAKEYASVFGVSADWLYSGDGPMREAGAASMVPIIGSVGANAEGVVLLALADERYDMAPAPPGAGEKVVALEVDGHSMRGFADDGSLIYFEDQRTPPTEDMLGHVVVCETEDGEVLVKRILRGGKKGRYDLESIAGPTLEDKKIRWAAFPSAIIPAYYARRLIRRAAEAA